jgi:hypothetical protein
MPRGPARFILHRCSRELCIAADEAAQHFVELRRMFAIGEVTGPIINVHARIGSAARDRIEKEIP